MTKSFCDICGKPALEVVPAESERKVGEPFGCGEKYQHQTTITTSLRFGFRNHPKGQLGPPDLCAGCAHELVAEILSKLNKLKTP